ncbi:MAG: hypothetical protein AAF721_28380 [Myxococcota bacterium]
MPRTWDPEQTESWLLPLAHEGLMHVHPPASYFDSLPDRPIYRSYPVYHPDEEPEGYREFLASVAPQIVWDDNGTAPPLETKEDWIAAGELVYDTAVDATQGGFWVPSSHDLSWIDEYRVPLASDGTVPTLRYIIREQGVVEIGTESCAMCHTRVLEGGRVIKATQGNFPAANLHAAYLRRPSTAEAQEQAAEVERHAHYRYHGSPWLGDDDPNARYLTISYEDFETAFMGVPPGVYPNHNGSLFLPAKAADLRTVVHRRYLDQTGHHRHRGPADLMRFADMHQLSTYYAAHGDMPPVEPPPPPQARGRASDTQLYALGLYLYSLEPVPSPHPFDAQAAAGREVFEREGCDTCHAGTNFTSERLTPVRGYEVPRDHPEAGSILDQVVGTDPDFALLTRKGTGFYKVPSLRGLWHRGPFEHNGSVATLEDWFDPGRLGASYVPTGWKGPPGTTTRAVPGHEFGLELSATDKRALIAYLLTL